MTKLCNFSRYTENWDTFRKNISDCRAGYHNQTEFSRRLVLYSRDKLLNIKSDNCL